MHLPRYSNLWLPGYVRGRMRRWARPGSPRPARVWLAIADHFEPLWNHVGEDKARERVQMWCQRWPSIAPQHRDSAGRPAVYTFFFPQEQYRESLLAPLAEMSAQGISDVEVHIHHDCEGQQDFVGRMSGFIETLSNCHGLLHHEDGQIKFGFIHGNWALGNSLPGGRWCGLNNEIQLLRDLGCYADFTMPSGSYASQARTVNEIYWAVNGPERPKAYDYGRPFQPSGLPGDLLMIPGPLGIRYRDRLVPRLEVGELACYDLPTPYRVARWLDIAPRIGGDIFIKLFTHGAQERNMIPLLEHGLAALFTMLDAECRKRQLSFYSVSTWQMYQAIVALGRSADPVATIGTRNRALV